MAAVCILNDFHASLVSKFWARKAALACCKAKLPPAASAELLTDGMGAPVVDRQHWIERMMENSNLHWTNALEPGKNLPGGQLNKQGHFLLWVLRASLFLLNSGLGGGYGPERRWGQRAYQRPRYQRRGNAPY